MKKPVPSLVIQESGVPVVQLTIWNQIHLKRDDWDFSSLSDFPQDMLRCAWAYELERELGSGNPAYFIAWELQELKKRKAKLLAVLDGTIRLTLEETKALLPVEMVNAIAQREADDEAALKKMWNPEMTREEAEDYGAKERVLYFARMAKLDGIASAEARATTTAWKPPTPKESEPILKSHPYDGLVEKVPNMPGYQWASGTGSHSTIHPLEIDWTLTERELVDAFRNWLRKGELHSPFHPKYKQLPSQSKVGKRKKAGWLAWLRELAIYRISQAGFTHAEGLEKMDLKPVGKDKKPAISAANWEHAQARTRERMLSHYSELCSLHRMFGHEDNGWRGWFVKPFRL
jgi:hypothetical protein